MAHVKRILCLANSRKLSGRCIAGREFDRHEMGRWIRPVSDREREDVSEDERQYPDGSDPRVLDVIDVPLREPRPREHQTENWLLDPEYYWEKVGQLSQDELAKFSEPQGALWIDDHSTIAGKNDKIPLNLLPRVKTSLRLIHVDTLTLAVFAPGAAFGNPKRKVQGRFTHAGRKYAFRVTDPNVERTCLAQPDGEHELGESCLTISLGKPFEGACYKLIAAVIELD